MPSKLANQLVNLRGGEARFGHMLGAKGDLSVFASEWVIHEQDNSLGQCQIHDRFSGSRRRAYRRD